MTEILMVWQPWQHFCLTSSGKPWKICAKSAEKISDLGSDNLLRNCIVENIPQTPLNTNLWSLSLAAYNLASTLHLFWLHSQQSNIADKPGVYSLLLQFSGSLSVFGWVFVGWKVWRDCWDWLSDTASNARLQMKQLHTLLQVWQTIGGRIFGKGVGDHLQFNSSFLPEQ